MRLPQLAALRGGIMTRTFTARGRPGPAMYVAAALIAGAGLAAVPAAAAASAATGARPAQAPSSLCPGANVAAFGSNVCVFSDTMSQATIQADLDNISTQQVPVASQFSSQRYAIFFLPGTYGSAADPLVFQVGYYTEVAGLGSMPQDTVINGAIDVFNNLCTAGTSDCNSDDNFWRSLSNLDLNVDLPSSPPAYAPPVPDAYGAGCANSAEIWSASQADPIRRAIVNGNVVFQDYCASNNFASGGFIADSKISGALDFYGNQQYMVRNSAIGGANGCPQGLWNMVYFGVQGAPSPVLIAEFERIVGGMAMLNERPPRSVDEAVAVGERLSALLLSEYLVSQGVPSAAINAWDVLVTDAVFGNASPLMEPTRTKARARVLPLIETGVVPVITGFNGATADGRPTTLGRGGSDFSASILAAALDASELWIWTDVDGIMSADPRLAPDAVVLDEITYAEAAELAYNGAKVLHARTLAPLVEKGIPVWSKNSFAPEKPGTKIVPASSAATGARAVTSMAKVALVSLEPSSPELSGVQIMARSLDALARVNVEVLELSSSGYRGNFCFLVREEELERAEEALEAARALELARGYVRRPHVDANVGLLAVVGEGMQGKPGLAGRVFTAISNVQVNIIAIAQGASELTIAMEIRRDGLEKAVRAVHAACGLGRG